MKQSKRFRIAAALVIAGVALASCASTADVLVNKDPDSFYGSAFAATEAAASEKAYLDLAYAVLTETGSIRPVKKANFVLTREIEEAFAGFKLKPEKAEKNKAGTRFDVVYRLPREKWAKAEALRLDRLNAEFGAAFASIQAGAAKPAAARIKESASLLAALERSGAINKIVGAGAGGPILADRVEAYCRGLVEGASVSAEPSGGLVRAGAPIVIGLAGKDGAPLAGFPLVLAWKADGQASGPIAALTDGKGRAQAAFPSDPGFAERKAGLSVAADLSSFGRELPFLKQLDQAIAAEFSYRDSAVAAAGGPGKAVKVPGGAYTVGSVKQDRRAGSVEKPRAATVAAFYIDANLVTNAEYRTYLEATGAAESGYPDYWENAELNQPDQPVVGLSLKEAEKYAAWLSSVQGVRKRLPTEDEFEIAARGGRDVVYPWGDELPSDGARATFKGNASYTTAVGSRAKGANALGLNDMAGNVWEWTTTAPAGTMSGDQGHRIVKGGSYLDGQYELRISNRALRDPEERYPDVGFRLVSEVGNE